MTSAIPSLSDDELRRRGLHATEMDGQIWAVTTEPDPVVRQLGLHAWLVQRKPRLMEAVRVGPGVLRTFVVRNRQTPLQDPGAYQMALSDHLAAEHLAWVLRDLKINCVLDVGANEGQFATRLRAAGFTGRIVSFEPVAAQLTTLRAAAEGDPDWHVVPHALGDADGDAEINVAAGKGTMSSLLPTNDFGRSNFKGVSAEKQPVETISIRRLDSLLDEAIAGLAAPRIFLKLDTQGYDLLALRGAGSRTDELLGLQSEVSCLPIYDGMPHLTEQLAEYEAAGFAITGLFPVSRQGDTPAVIEFDVVMIRRDALDA